MIGQNINQYVSKNLGVLLSNESYDMSLSSDELEFNQEVVFSPYLIAQTYGDRLPVYFDTNNSLTSQKQTLTYKNYDPTNIFVSQNYYNPKNLDLTCFTFSASCDIGLTGIDNGLVDVMTGQTIHFTNGLYDDTYKFNRMFFDRRLKLFQVTGYTSSNQRFSGFDKTILYEVVSKTGDTIGVYHELYGGFYQGFYRLFGYDYEVLPERMNKGWSVEMLLKPRLSNEYEPNSGETTLNQIYTANTNTFFYLGARAENKFYHHADGYPGCNSGYTRVTSGLTSVETCACCNTGITNSRCIYVYPPRSVNNQHDPHINYGCSVCSANKPISASCECTCGDYTCVSCGWECQTHTCPTPPICDITVEVLLETPFIGTPDMLGRKYQPDERDNNYLISNHFELIKNKVVRIKPTPTRTPTPTRRPSVSPTSTPTPTPTPVITSKYWGDDEWWGNQGNTPQCVGYAWAHWIEDGPITHDGIPPIVSPTLIYTEAQKVDEWPGENYDGTSVRGAAKYLKSTNRISSYYWAFDVNTLKNVILNIGPVVVGTNWYNSMFYPDSNGLIRVSGGIAGGHAYVINGIDTAKQQFRIKNSWGRNWGKSGHAYISFSDMSRLINENGEICLAVENIF